MSNPNVALYIKDVNESYTLDDIWDRVEYFEYGIIEKIVLLPVSKMVIYGPNTRNVIVYFERWYRNDEAQFKLSLLLQGKPIYIYYNMISYWTVVAYDQKHKKIAKAKKVKKIPVKDTDAATAATTAASATDTAATATAAAAASASASATDTAAATNPIQPDIVVQPVEEDDEDLHMYDDLAEEPTTMDYEISQLLSSIEKQVVNDMSLLTEKSNADKPKEIEKIEKIEEIQETEDIAEDPVPQQRCSSHWMDIDAPRDNNTTIDYGEAILPKKKKQRKMRIIVIS